MTSTTTVAALTPVSFGGRTLANRITVAPMSRVSATPDGVPTARMADYYAAFAAGGFGLVTTEGVFTDTAFSRSYPDQPGLVTASHVAGWRQVTDAVHRHDTPIFAQLMHAGALSQTLARTAAPSVVQPKGAKMTPYGGGPGPYPLPQELTVADIETAIAGFAHAAVQARAAGFDGVEIHGANGYLVDQFLTGYTNLRTDRYGGDPAGRVRFAVDVITAIRAAVGADFTLGIRLSQTKVNDFEYRWSGPAEAEVIFGAVAAAGVDFLHIASEGRDWLQTARLAGGPTITRLAREVTGLPVIANGGMHHSGQAQQVLTEGHADLVALGRGALANPDWPQRLAEGREFASFDHAVLEPTATLRSLRSRGEVA